MTDNIFKLLAIDVRESIDAEQLVYELLNRAYPCNEWPDVQVCSEIDLPLNAYSERGQVVLYYVSAPEQFDRGLWRFGVTFTVLAADGNDPSGFARHLYRTVKNWPFEDSTTAGTVGTVSVTAQKRQADAKENQGKNIKEYWLSAVVTARDPFKA